LSGTSQLTSAPAQTPSRPYCELELSQGKRTDDEEPGAPGRSDEWPQPRIWKYYVSERGNGNAGHEYGTRLSAQEKDDLIEYLKTL